MMRAGAVCRLIPSLLVVATVAFGTSGCLLTPVPAAVVGPPVVVAPRPVIVVPRRPHYPHGGGYYRGGYYDHGYRRGYGHGEGR